MQDGAASITPYVVDAPNRQQSAVVFASPHSGGFYPDDLMVATKLSELALRRSADNFVDHLNGMYALADSGEIQDFPGVTSPYEEPVAADLTLAPHTDALDACVEKILELLKQRGFIR